MIYFLENFNFLLKQNQLSLEKISDKTKISVDEIEKIKKGLIEPNLLQLLTISEVLNYPTDRILKENISKTQQLLENFNFKMLMLDVDGVLTDGGMYYTQNCDEYKKFDTKDGMAIKKLTNAAYNVGFVSSGINETIIRKRAELLGVQMIYVGTWDKLGVVEKWSKELEIGLENMAYIGDDVNDFAIMQKVGLSACPADSVGKIKEIAKIILSKKGGEGCVREFVDNYLMKIE
ncbi:MAG: HAD hydrolase family protein [Bacteroidales bacterium]|jgi:YrbI family 3-deoxy-D-manno-octulosonate 8-phosphate phosphatase